MTTSTSAFYTVYLTDADGVRLADASDFLELTYARVVNAPSYLSIELPVRSTDMNNIVLPDGRIEVWRSVDGRAAVLEMECSWLIQSITQSIDQNGERRLIVEAAHPLWALQEIGRSVMAKARTAEARKSGAADDIIKQIVREQAASPTDSTRQLPISVAVNTSQAPVISKAFAWRPVLEVVQEIAEDVTQDGTYLAFDIVNTGSSDFEFRTYIDQRGIDRRFPNGVVPLLIGPEYGNVGQVNVKRDWSSEVTAVNVLGPGQGNQRRTTLVVDTSRSLRSPWRYREMTLSLTQADTAAERRAEGNARLRAGRPFVQIEGRLLSTKQSLYGRDWNWGDYLTMQTGFGYTIDCRVDAVQVRVSPEREQIDAILRGEQFL
jgi:hypothetical protein